MIETLFPLPEVTPRAAPATRQVRGAVRLLQANRAQLFLRSTDLESTLPLDHAARTVWAFVHRLDVSRFHESILSREGEPGRPAIDPAILITLWVYAISEGVGSAREIDRLCRCHDAYRWICGGVPMNYHTVSDFRTDHRAALDDLFTQIIAAMMKGGLISLTRVAQDGTRVRASAGADSFRREPTLEAYLADAKAQLAHAEQAALDPTLDAKCAAAELRAAREREARICQALEELPKLRACKSGEEEKRNARVSTTDAEARVMKMPDGGFRPAFNVQFGTTTEDKVMLGVSVTNSGSDSGQLSPMLDQIEQRCGERPKEVLVDGGYVHFEQFDDAAKKATTVYAPVPSKRGAEPDYTPKETDSPAVGEWRQRMGTEEAKAIYRERAETAELVNARAKGQFGFTQFLVRGLDKVLTVGLWIAITYNLFRWARLTNV